MLLGHLLESCLVFTTNANGPCLSLALERWVHAVPKIPWAPLGSQDAGAPIPPSVVVRRELAMAVLVRTGIWIHKNLGHDTLDDAQLIFKDNCLSVQNSLQILTT